MFPTLKFLTTRSPIKVINYSTREIVDFLKRLTRRVFAQASTKCYFIVNCLWNTHRGVQVALLHNHARLAVELRHIDLRVKLSNGFCVARHIIFIAPQGM